jgi:SEC-C motif
LVGVLAFVAEASGKERLEDEYQIELSVPGGFPGSVPSVRETGGRIPPSFHKLADGALCLGSPTRLRLILSESPSILRFVERCVIPYLYGYSYFERHGILPFGELDHGDPGIRQDFASIFHIDQEEMVREFVRLTSMRKRHANKQPCPCGSQRRLGRCHYRRVNSLRGRLGRYWFRMVLRNSELLL